jgi:hypothetical protein
MVIVPAPRVGGGGGVGSVDEVDEDGGKLMLNVIGGGGDLDGRRRSLRREALLTMVGRRALLTQRTMASSEAQIAWVAGSGAPCDEAMRADLLFENSAGAFNVAEPQGALRLELVLEGGMGAG